MTEIVQINLTLSSMKWNYSVCQMKKSYDIINVSSLIIHMYDVMNINRDFHTMG